MLAALVIGAMIAAQMSAPSDRTPQEPVTQLEDVDALGRRGTVEERARDYVGTMSSAAVRNRNPARWENSVCVGTINVGSPYAQALVDRVSDVAKELGLQAGRPGCNPNVVIVMTTDAQATAAEMVLRRPGVFRPDLASLSLGRNELEDFVRRSAPVRWWHVNSVIDTRSGLPATGGENPREPPVMNTYGGGSFIRSQLRDYIRKAIIVVDVDDVATVSFDQLADYVAFVALAQADPDADTAGYDTVLNLFKGDTTASLTAWDRAYLQGLYEADPSLGSGRQMYRHIASGLVRAIERSSPANGSSGASQGGAP